ncbi:MAG: hypothetical protein CL760_06565 [Chloroflexi bacterium]|nr:hypothetical protein [Chloroflexota bacterium]
MSLFLNWFIVLICFNILIHFATMDKRTLDSNIRKAVIVSSVSISFFLAAFSWWAIIPLGATVSTAFIFAISAGAIQFSAFMFCDDAAKISNVVMIWVFAFIVNFYTGHAFFNHKEISSVLQPIEVSEPMFTEIQEQEQRLVPIEIARDKQSKVINGRLEDGTMISSMYKLDFNSTIIQVVKGEKVYVTPLTWNGSFKWFFNDYDVIGYAVTKASDPDAPTKLVVKNKDGSDISFKITEDGYLGTNLARHIHAELDNSLIIQNSFMMLDEEEYPYYVSYIVKSVAGIGNYAADGVVVTDPQTKEVIRYKNDEIPSFIEASAAESTLITNINNWGEYRKGYWESWGSSIKIKATSYNNKSELFFIDAKGTLNGLAYFTGLEGDSSQNKSLSGMLFIDPITLKSYIYYPESESQNEMAVLDSVKASLGNLSDKWTPTQPIPYRIFGDVDVWMTPIIPINGTSRKIEAYAYTKIFSTEKSAWDVKLSNAMSKLLTNSSDSGLISNSKAVTEQLVGNVRTIYFINGSAYLTIHGYDKVIECNHETNVECRGVMLEQLLDINTIEKTEKEVVLVDFNENPLKQ